MTQISGLVITLNEAHNIVDCLRSMKTVCDDIVVVDSGSSDGTVELARQEGATVIVQVPFLGDGPQRSHGLPYCRHAWVLNLDADERLEQDLIDYIRRTDLDSLGVDLVETRRRNYIGQRFTPYAGQYPDYVKRLFNRLKADFTPVTAHTYIQASSFIRINAHIIHYSYRDYPDMVVKCKYAGWIRIAGGNACACHAEGYAGSEICFFRPLSESGVGRCFHQEAGSHCAIRFSAYVQFSPLGLHLSGGHGALL